MAPMRAVWRALAVWALAGTAQRRDALPPLAPPATFRTGVGCGLPPMLFLRAARSMTPCVFTFAKIPRGKPMGSPPVQETSGLGV